MKNYTDIKIARSDLRKLKEIYCYCKKKQERLKSNLTKEEPFEVRCEAFVYRLALNEMAKRITRLKSNIKKLDKEIAKAHLEEILK